MEEIQRGLQELALGAPTGHPSKVCERLLEIAGELRSLPGQDLAPNVSSPAVPVEPQIPLPEKFSGNREDFPNFRDSCLLYFQVRPIASVTTRQRIGVVISLLKEKMWLFDYLLMRQDNSNVEYKVLHAICSTECLPGYRKALREGFHICCYDCVPCSEGEISNQSDSENCQTCPESEWPNDTKNICVSKVVEYLSYEKDVLVIIFSVSSILFAATSVFILGLFFWFRSTPMVKANNRNLSFILLCSLTLSFLSMFLFLGRPVDITCMLQQIFFGIVFTISVSSILAKTIMVFIAFKASRPGSSCRKWVGVKLPNTVMLFCSSIQVINGILWLSISPPFQEYDMHSYPGKIIIQCNEGSTLSFYITLGYMGFLAAVSFVLAFMVRTLPDSFNEAKYITFSMLVFCSVWIAMIPAFLSTRGKYMVAVEVFAILTSSAGVLFCIFFPKLYILLFKPELNTRKSMLE
ncbi:vomeronasal type-2 receptor 26-like [Pyxicephalus adspersus]|uniref:vomeronasal type-2 receptor 26-like n=1 Tax=Pyxicephalus adspersus TaxID=30357 RepID=UPI003B5C0A2C